MMNEIYAMVNTVKDMHTLECIRNLTQLLQTMATQMKELKIKLVNLKNFSNNIIVVKSKITFVQ